MFLTQGPVTFTLNSVFKKHLLIKELYIKHRDLINKTLKCRFNQQESKTQIL